MDAINITTTTVILASSVSQLLLARNPKRQYLAIQNTGTAAVSLGFYTAPTVAGGGISLDAPTANGGQGGVWEWTRTVPTNPVYGYSAAGTTVVVIEG